MAFDSQCAERYGPKSMSDRSEAGEVVLSCLLVVGFGQQKFGVGLEPSAMIAVPQLNIVVLFRSLAFVYVYRNRNSTGAVLEPVL